MNALLILGSIVLAGCAGSARPEPSMDKAPVTPDAAFFTFDAIDLYHTDLGEDAVFDGNGATIKGKEGLSAILLDEIPKDLADTTWLVDLGSIGYAHTPIPASLHEDIDALFTEKMPEVVAYKACVAEYRDILVFRKQGRITGIAKVCFGCGQNHIVGTTANTEFFGLDGDYSRLRHILDPFRSV